MRAKDRGMTVGFPGQRWSSGDVDVTSVAALGGQLRRGELRLLVVDGGFVGS